MPRHNGWVITAQGYSGVYYIHYEALPGISLPGLYCSMKGIIVRTFYSRIHFNVHDKRGHLIINLFLKCIVAHVEPCLQELE